MPASCSWRRTLDQAKGSHTSNLLKARSTIADNREEIKQANNTGNLLFSRSARDAGLRCCNARQL